MSTAKTVLLSVIATALAGHAIAQTTPQQRPDARYPNPSGQDSAPSKTEVKPTKPAPPSKAPQDSSRGEAAPNTYVDGKKKDVSGGCSTPTDAQSAGAKTRDADKTVCTNSGEHKTPRGSQQSKPRE